MTEVPALQSIVERLTSIASDCFDMRAVERLRALAEELASKPQAPPVMMNGARNPETDAEGA